MGKLGDFYGCDWRDGVEVMDIHENEKGTWDELEKGLLTRGEGRDHQDGAVNGRRKGYEGCSRYYKVGLVILFFSLNVVVDSIWREIATLDFQLTCWFE